MAPAIPPGSYVLRSPRGNVVLHQDGSRKGSITLAKRDEEQYRDAQTFWIEPIPEYECDNGKEGDGPIYQILHLATGESLEVTHAKTDKDAPVGMYATHGAPCQLWKFVRLDRKDGYVMRPAHVLRLAE
jgi:hypothetical protein